VAVGANKTVRHSRAHGARKGIELAANEAIA